MQTLTSFLEDDTHQTQPLTLAPEMRVFLSELFVRLGETLRPGKGRGAQRTPSSIKVM